MARYEDMLIDLRSAAYGAPDAILVRALVRATQDLCKFSQCWRETLDDVYVQSGVGVYEFGAPYESSVDRVLWVTLGGRRINDQHRPDDLQAQPVTAGAPRMFAQHAHRQELLLWPTPGANEHQQVLSVHAVLSPTLRSTELPDGLVDEYGQGIVAAAKADLLMNSPGMPWHNPQAAQHQRMSADEVFVRAKRAQHSGHSVPLAVRNRRFA